MYKSPSGTATVEFGHRRVETDHRSQQQMSSSLLRFFSAPSSLLAEVCNDFIPMRNSNAETESMFARILEPSSGGEGGSDERKNLLSTPPSVEQIGGFASASSQMLYQPQRLHQQQSPMVESSNLFGQSSSPSGLFSQLNADSGYGLMRMMAAGRLKGQISWSSRQSSLSQISEMGAEDISGGDCSPEESPNSRCLVSGYPVVSSWESPLLSDRVSPDSGGGLKRTRDQTEPQEGELSNRFSMTKASPEVEALEKLFQFGDVVPCKVRAKRGCATHPRSIAERVRRTRITERMRKLQELVPNMDKQISTADMLDFAVDYIKDLQRQVKLLSSNRASCTCSGSKQKPYHWKAT
ncbi:hypothetical protein HPP92_015244 [Vanilla planifolia]|uniref:BHLH domain-containing protein n=1 Tax=Vanilla planifolia TaxID=51239 RepID=A0A835QPS3_VANPL|nr:hypothetical protein HPP92_015764 [Vanilla planifolia]KAG0475558.1 hypothetical protein HPP92_015244 [Vanilla planifolia]